jgi:hypothetical protein
VLDRAARELRAAEQAAARRPARDG